MRLTTDQLWLSPTGPESLSEESCLLTSGEQWAIGIMMGKLDLSIEPYSEGHPKMPPITHNRWEMSQDG